MSAAKRVNVTGYALLLGVLLAGFGWLLHTTPPETPGRPWWPWLIVAGVAFDLAVIVGWLHRRSSSRGRVERWAAQTQRNDGVASTLAIWRTAGRHAMHRRARVLRPALREVGPLARLRVPTRELATPLARVGWQRIWSPIEDVTLRVGGPRTGKTGEIAGRILDAPGAVIATTTRTDLIKITARCRARKGPVHVFNPSGFAGQPTSIVFDPLSGCEDYTVAVHRAEDLLSASDAPGQGGDREYWDGQARRALALLMHAAALAGADMAQVMRWLGNAQAAGAEVPRALRKSPQRASIGDDAIQFLTTNDRTRTSITSSVTPALAWLHDPVALAAATPTEGAGGFDVAELLATRGTVYMLGAEDSEVAPLVAALTGHIAREARRIAGESLDGRLDPPLTLALDEAALICPIPLDNWTADMGGRNITIHIAVQSRAQLRQRWGDTGAAAILNNAATVMVFGGTRDPDDLAAWSALTGERREPVVTYDEHGKLSSTSDRRVPVLSRSDIAQLPARHVLIVRRGMAPAIGTVQMAWRRRDVRVAAARERWAARIARLQARAAADWADLTQWWKHTARPWLARAGALIWATTKATWRRVRTARRGEHSEPQFRVIDGGRR